MTEESERNGSADRRHDSEPDVGVDGNRVRAQIELILWGVIGDAASAADQVCLEGYRAAPQISIFPAISIASSTSMPR